MELNKIMAAVLLAGLIAMATGTVARILMPEPYLTQNAYLVDTGADVAEEAAEEEVVQDIGPLLASADPTAGEAASRACIACHSFDEGGANKVGPNLYDIVGHAIGAVDGFNYSDVLADMGTAGDVWTYEALDGFLANPRGWAPGTAMSYAGMRDINARAEMIAWLRTLSGDPEPLPGE